MSQPWLYMRDMMTRSDNMARYKSLWLQLSDLKRAPLGGCLQFEDIASEMDALWRGFNMNEIEALKDWFKQNKGGS